MLRRLSDEGMPRLASAGCEGAKAPSMERRRVRPDLGTACAPSSIWPTHENVDCPDSPRAGEADAAIGRHSEILVRTVTGPEARPTGFEV